MKKVTVRKPKIGCTQKTMCVYILKYYIIVCTSKKVVKGPITRKTAGLGNSAKGTWREKKKWGPWAL